MDNLDEWLETTAPFHTFESCDVEKLMLAISLLEDSDKSEKNFTLLMENDEISQRISSQGIESPQSRSEIGWDDATFAWICSLPKSSGLPEPLGSDKCRERLGRFPWGDGSPLSYLQEYITEQDDGSELLEFIQLLAERLSEKMIGHARYRQGVGGMCLLGYLDRSECDQLRKLLSRGKWAVSSEEIFDGGVREIAKHLIIVLRQASTRGFGLLLRAHS